MKTKNLNIDGLVDLNQDEMRMIDAGSEGLYKLCHLLGRVQGHIENAWDKICEGAKKAKDYIDTHTVGSMDYSGYSGT